MTQASHVLAAAFADDPFISYFWPDPARRRKALPGFWASRIASRERHGLVDVARDPSGDIAAVALWEPEGVTSAPIARPYSLIRALGTALPRALSASHRVDATRPSADHLYLAVIGTRPDVRGQGYARQLLEPRLAEADLAFLVATDFANVPFYERLGFRRDADLAIPGGPVLYPMRRTA
ncbi:GNAT family N-acetyltransferase [Nocardia puris]|uniref:Acetyltransferase (GNAT) family protein n=1 Tax=Nocardia puris TaxID=208602 RepID=A0A366E324_9NOCA|nr:GNAT family N-acetyltransferase [Nocardia puris]MBF6209556.1 GNAT family N-acetyltransferase [Nocardia puris]MBF6366128.1 GNAT family N-acetyltransferase [Nocardia puris]MBF6458531.1 GNAT family N-acetyltransferase [Nocardia puris]RBO96179.1 acetyltransferase (GNAT) family protein [Nocardia puris]